MDLCISVFVYVGSIVLYKRIVNAHTQSIRIANADGQERLKTEEFETFCLCLHSNSLPLRVLPLIQEGEFY